MVFVKRLLLLVLVPALLIDGSLARRPEDQAAWPACDYASQALAPSPNFSWRGALTQIHGITTDIISKKAVILMMTAGLSRMAAENRDMGTIAIRYGVSFLKPGDPMPRSALLLILFVACISAVWLEDIAARALVYIHWVFNEITIEKWLFDLPVRKLPVVLQNYVIRSRRWTLLYLDHRQERRAASHAVNRSPLTIMEHPARSGMEALDAWEELQDEGTGGLREYQQQRVAKELDGTKLLDGAYVIRSRSGSGDKPWIIKVRPSHRAWLRRKPEVEILCRLTAITASSESRLVIKEFHVSGKALETDLYQETLRELIRRCPPPTIVWHIINHVNRESPFIDEEKIASILQEIGLRRGDVRQSQGGSIWVYGTTESGQRHSTELATDDAYPQALDNFQRQNRLPFPGQDYWERKFVKDYEATMHHWPSRALLLRLRQAVADGQVDQTDLEEFLAVTGPVRDQASMGYLDLERFLDQRNPMTRDPFRWQFIAGYDQADLESSSDRHRSTVWLTRLINRDHFLPKDLDQLRRFGIYLCLISMAGLYRNDPTLPFSFFGYMLDSASPFHTPLFNLVSSPEIYQLDYSIEQAYTGLARGIASALRGRFGAGLEGASVVGRRLFRNRDALHHDRDVVDLGRFLKTRPELIFTFPALEGGRYLNWSVLGPMVYSAMGRGKRTVHEAFMHAQFQVLRWIALDGKRPLSGPAEDEFLEVLRSAIELAPADGFHISDALLPFPGQSRIPHHILARHLLPRAG